MLDRLTGFHQHKGRRRSGTGELHGRVRPLHDRAIVHTLLGTGLSPATRPATEPDSRGRGHDDGGSGAVSADCLYARLR